MSNIDQEIEQKKEELKGLDSLRIERDEILKQTTVLRETLSALVKIVRESEEKIADLKKKKSEIEIAKNTELEKSQKDLDERFNFLRSEQNSFESEKKRFLIEVENQKVIQVSIQAKIDNVNSAIEDLKKKNAQLDTYQKELEQKEEDFLRLVEKNELRARKNEEEFNQNEVNRLENEAVTQKNYFETQENARQEEKNSIEYARLQKFQLELNDLKIKNDLRETEFFSREQNLIKYEKDLQEREKKIIEEKKVITSRITSVEYNEARLAAFEKELEMKEKTLIYQKSLA